MIDNKRVVSFSLAKNEEDIIESFVRHNLQYIDHMYIADNLSSDATLQILNELKNEGLPITIWIDSEPAHLQSKKTTDAYRKISKDDNFDLFVLLDADELLIVGENVRLDGFNPGEVLELKRSCYIISNLNADHENVIEGMTRRMNVLQSSKAAIFYDSKKLSKIRIGEGSHYVYYNGVSQSRLACDLEIAHFPYRGLDHYLSKIFVGWHNMILKDTNVLTQENPIASHWRSEYNYVMNRGGVLNFQELIKRLYKVDDFDVLDDFSYANPIDVNYRNKYFNYRKKYSPLYLVSKSHENLINIFHQAKRGHAGNLKNIAKQGSVIQSSVYKNSEKCQASGAINGAIDQKYGFHTDKEKNPWWQLDLGKICKPSLIEIHNRRDCLQERACTLKVEVSTDCVNWECLHSGISYFGFDEEAMKIFLKNKIDFRFLKLSLDAEECLHLSSVCVWQD